MLVSVLAGILLYQNWQSYGAASNARQAFASVRATIRVMEHASAERGPMNAALGSALPVPDAVTASLAAARARTDGLIDALLALHPASDDPKRSEIQRIRQALDRARQDIDARIATPRDRLSGQLVWDAVSGMVRIIPEWQASLAANAGLVMRSEANAPSLLTLALLASELREQAGLLGSTFTPALSRHRKLTAEEQFRIERVLGRIDELRALIDARMATHPDVRASDVYARMAQRYFDEGLAYLGRVREQASRQSDEPPVSTGEVAADYVPLMGAITEFRDVLLDEMERHIDAHRVAAARLLFVTLGATALLVAALAVALVQFRKRVIQPFALATRIIGSIASGAAPARIPPGKHHGEVEEVFNALRVLKENSAAQKRLEAERDRLIADLAHIAETDFLTGLLNRRAFEKRFEAARAHWDEDRPMLAFILFDIDHFKTINDTHGHATGDLALKAVAELCRATWRQSDVVARVGGEEFAVLCRTRGARQAVELAERMRAGICACAVTSEGGATFGLTASFGVACISWSHAESASGLFRAADELLYLAKLNGRNQVQQRTLG